MSYIGEKNSEEYYEHFERPIRIIIDSPVVYQELKELLKRVVHQVVDVDEYVTISDSICNVLKDLTNGQNVMIFDLFIAFNNPFKGGLVQSFRRNCKILLQQLDDLRIYRQEKIPMRIVVNNASVKLKFIERRKKKAKSKNLKRGIIL